MLCSKQLTKIKIKKPLNNSTFHVVNVKIQDRFFFFNCPFKCITVSFVSILCCSTRSSNFGRGRKKQWYLTLQCLEVKKRGFLHLQICWNNIRIAKIFLFSVTMVITCSSHENWSFLSNRVDNSSWFYRYFSFSSTIIIM